MFALLNRHTARLCQLALAGPCIVLALASGCDTLLSIEKPVRASAAVEPDGGVVLNRPGPAPDDDAGALADAASMMCTDEMECCPDCTGASCGSDGCGGSCGDCKNGGVCTKDRTCTCLPDCKGKRCG